MPSASSVLALLATLCLSVASCLAQSWPQHTLWSQTLAQMNPASSANMYSLDATVGYRKQWLDLPGAPSTARAALAAPIYRIRSGTALALEYDEVGLQASTAIRASFAYQILQTDDIALSAGFGAVFRNIELDGSSLRTDDGIYEGGAINHQDPSLPTVPVSGSGFGFNAGIELKFRESTVGLSVNDLNDPVLDLEGINRVWPKTLNFYATSLIPVAELIDLDATLLVRTDLSVYQTQVGATAWYAGNIGVGAALRGFDVSTLDAVSLLLGWRPSQSVVVAYSYDYGLSDLSNAHDNSHEIVLRYTMSDPIGKGKLPPVIFNPRL